jgi:hypothetical protein
MATMNYKLVLAEGMSLHKLVIHQLNVNVGNDRKSPTVYEGSGTIYPTEDKILLHVEVSSPMVGLEWELDITVGGIKLTETPIKCRTTPSGKADVTLTLPWS